MENRNNRRCKLLLKGEIMKTALKLCIWGIFFNQSLFCMKEYLKPLHSDNEYAFQAKNFLKNIAIKDSQHPGLIFYLKNRIISTLHILEKTASDTYKNEELESRLDPKNVQKKYFYAVLFALMTTSLTVQENKKQKFIESKKLAEAILAAIEPKNIQLYSNTDINNAQLNKDVYKQCALEFLKDILSKNKSTQGLFSFLKERMLAAQMILDNKISIKGLECELYGNLSLDYFTKSLSQKSNLQELLNASDYYELLYALFVNNITTFELNNKISCYKDDLHTIEKNFPNIIKNYKNVSLNTWNETVNKKYTYEELLILRLAVSYAFSKYVLDLIPSVIKIDEIDYGSCNLCQEKLTFKNVYITPCCKKPAHKACLYKNLKNNVCTFCKGKLSVDGNKK